MLAWLGRPSTNRIYTIPSPAHSYQTDSITTILWSRICGFIPYIHLVSGGVEYERWMEFIVLRAGEVVVAQMLHRLQRKRHILLAKLANMVDTQHWRVKARTGDVLRCTPQLAWAMLFSNVTSSFEGSWNDMSPIAEDCARRLCLEKYCRVVISCTRPRKCHWASSETNSPMLWIQVIYDALE